MYAASATRSREEVPSIEFATLASKPSSVAARLFGPSDVPASAPTVRADRKPAVKITDPIAVPQQRPGVCQQVVREQHRLSVLQVGTARHGNTKMITCLVVQCADNIAEPQSHCPERVSQVHPDQGRNLVVARATGPQSAAQLGADQLNQPPLKRAMHVLVGFCRPEGSEVTSDASSSRPSSIAVSSSSVSNPALCKALACARDPARS